MIGRKVLVTGADGFIGAHLTARLAAIGAEVHALVRPRSHPTPQAAHFARLLRADLRDERALRAAVDESQPELVMHLGAFSNASGSWTNASDCLDVNTCGTARLLAALEYSAVERFVFVSTAEVYGDARAPCREGDAVLPASPYAVSKHAAEQLCRLNADAGRSTVVARLSATFGPGQRCNRIVPTAIMRAFDGKDITLVGREYRREFNYIDDVVDALEALLVTDGIDGETFNIGSGQEMRIVDLVNTIVGLVAERVPNVLFDRLPERRGELRTILGDSSKARTRLGWRPRTSIVDGLTETIAMHRRDLLRR